MRALALASALLVACASRAPTPIAAPPPPPTAVDAGAPEDAPAVTAAPVVTALPLGDVTQIALSDFNSCALSAGRLVCWRGGPETWAPAGGFTREGPEPAGAVALPGFTNVTSLCVASSLVCALRRDGVRCRARVSFPPEQENPAFDDEIIEGAPPGLSDVVALESTPEGCVARSRDGRRRAVTPPEFVGQPWSLGALGAGPPRCVIADGAARCVGDNSRALLANSTAPAFVAAAPSTLFGLTGVRAVGFAESHACAALNDGTLRCWGRNLEAQLGTGDLRRRALPTVIAGIDGVAAVGASGSYSCALREAGDVRCWGLNVEGVLGDGTTTPRRTPTADVTVTNVEELSVAEEYTCARRRDGGVWCWGARRFSTDPSDSRPHPVRWAASPP